MFVSAFPIDVLLAATSVLFLKVLAAEALVPTTCVVFFSTGFVVAGGAAVRDAAATLSIFMLPVLRSSLFPVKK